MMRNIFSRASHKYFRAMIMVRTFETKNFKFPIEHQVTKVTERIHIASNQIDIEQLKVFIEMFDEVQMLEDRMNAFIYRIRQGL